MSMWMYIFWEIKKSIHDGDVFEKYIDCFIRGYVKKMFTE